MAKDWFWRPYPIPDDDPDSFTLMMGGKQPVWFFNEMALRRIVPLPRPKFGDEPWGTEGVEVVATKRQFKIGETIHRSDLNS